MRFQGSYTVEAALLMAVLIPLLAGVLYLGFYMHDKAFMKSAAYEAAILENMDGKREPGKINDGLLGIRGAGLEVSGDNRRVSAEASGTFLLPGFVAEFFCGGQLQLSAFAEQRVTDPGRTLIRLRLAKRFAEEVKHGSDVSP